MNKRKHINDLLIQVYDQEEKVILLLSDQEAKDLLIKLQKIEVKNKKNPNSFFIIKELPTPKTWETKTTTRGGWMVIAAFVVLMLCFLGIFLFLALSR